MKTLPLKIAKAVVLSVAEKVTGTQNLKSLVKTPDRNSMNTGFSAAKVSTLNQVFGDFNDLPTNCGKITNQKIARMVTTRDVGPFRVTGIKPALDDLEAMFAEIKVNDPELYDLLGTAGMTCYRCVRGRPDTPSNHAAGTAIDMKIGGTLTLFNAAFVPLGLVKLYAYFHKYGWFWAAGYRGRTDPMHFEVSNERLLQWHADGKI